jgi:hypothetical protein
MPAHSFLATPAELGLIAVPADGEGVADGLPLR